MTHPSADALFDHLAADDARVVEHVRTCAACREELDRMRALVHAVRAMDGHAAPTADDLAITAALDEALGEAPPAPKARWPWLAGAVAFAAAAALAAVALPPAPAERLTVRAVDAESGALVAELGEGALVTFEAPVRVVLADGVVIELDAHSTFALVDLSLPDVAVRLDAGTLRWTLDAGDHALTVLGADPPLVVRAGRGDVTAGAAAPAPEPEPPRKPSRPRRGGAASDVKLPPPPVPVEGALADAPPVEAPPAEAPPEPAVEPVVASDPRPAPADAPRASDPEALYRAAEAALADGDPDTALLLFEEIARRWPYHPSGRLALFDRARLIERLAPERAAAAWRRYVDLGPDEPLHDAALARLCRYDRAACR